MPNDLVYNYARILSGTQKRFGHNAWKMAKLSDIRGLIRYALHINGLTLETAKERLDVKWFKTAKLATMLNRYFGEVHIKHLLSLSPIKYPRLK